MVMLQNPRFRRQLIFAFSLTHIIPIIANAFFCHIFNILFCYLDVLRRRLLEISPAKRAHYFKNWVTTQFLA